MEHSADNGAAARKNIYRTTVILAAITTLEFIIAFGMTGESMYAIKVAIFVLLTIVKAYYIVSIFMHLGDEAKKLIMAISIPFVFLVWLLIALGKEGDSYGDLTTFKGNTQPQPIEKVAAPAAHEEHTAPATEVKHDSTATEHKATEGGEKAPEAAPKKEEAVKKVETAKPAEKAPEAAAKKETQSKQAPAKVEKKGK